MRRLSGLVHTHSHVSYDGQHSLEEIREFAKKDCRAGS
jgi:hypothetical protein